MALLSVRIWDSSFEPVPFCIDSGADVSSIPISLARTVGIPFLRDPARGGTSAGLVGSVQRFRGYLTVSIAGVIYSWPCDFLDAPGPSSVDAYGVIGRDGFADDFAFCMNKPHFTLRRRTWWTLFFPPWTSKHDVGTPL